MVRGHHANKVQVHTVDGTRLALLRRTGTIISAGPMMRPATAMRTFMSVWLTWLGLINLWPLTSHQGSSQCDSANAGQNPTAV